MGAATLMARAVPVSAWGTFSFNYIVPKNYAQGMGKIQAVLAGNEVTSIPVMLPGGG